MGFNEKTHAFLAARYYVRLTEAFPDRGEQAFIHATQHYAEQRGRRMAQRAIRDGMPLTYETYRRYGEWVNTEEIVAAGCANRSEMISWEPDYAFRVLQCPWHAQFAEMGLPEAGAVYCAHLDNSICRGFNPYLQYEVPQTLHYSDCCIQIVRNAGIPQGSVQQRKTEYLKGFDYHCAHSYWSYRETVSAIFGDEGAAIADAVLADFAEAYGAEMAETIRSFAGTNFNICD